MSDAFNPYIPPSVESQNEVIALQNSKAPRYYVVSPTKFLVLMIVTVGFYVMYWFYKNWQNYKLQTNEAMWPIARGFFSIFFAHSLFDKVDKTLMTNNIARNWQPQFLATMYVVFQIVANVTDRLAGKEIGSPVTDGVSFVALAAMTYFLYQAQMAINAACLDQNGSSNSRFTAANYFWIVLGVILWVLMIVGYYMTGMGIE